MLGKNTLWLLSALSIGSAALAEPARCPRWEAGTRYPWQSNAILRGDLFAWLFLDVDRAGYPFRCKFGNNNFPDAESRVWVCKQYYDRWRGPPAGPSDPAVRTLSRFTLIPAPQHQALDIKARKTWFSEHPEERPECYPEPSRPDRMDL
jgi:hypothetical protein